MEGYVQMKIKDTHRFYFFKKALFIFRERGREEEGNIRVWLPLRCPLLGAWPATQAYVLIGNQTHDPLVRRLSAQSTEPHQSGHIDFTFNPYNFRGGGVVCFLMREHKITNLKKPKVIYLK